jgi:hypothetical protein
MQAIDALLQGRVPSPAGIASGEVPVWNGSAWVRSSVTQIGASSLSNTGKPLGLTGATAATRYVGATASGAPTSGTFAVGDFVVDQTGFVYVCTAAGTPGTWAKVGGSSGVTLIGAVTLGSATATLDTSSAGWLNGNIPGTYTHLRMVLSARGDASAANVGINMQFNGDTGANYWFGGWYIANVAQTSPWQYTNASDSAKTAIQIGPNGMPGATAAASAFNSMTFEFPLYLKTDRQKFCAFVGTDLPGEHSGGGNGNWNSTAAITKIVLTPVSGNFAAGTYAALYGVPG